MNPTANKSDFEDLTTSLRDLAYSYLENTIHQTTTKSIFIKKIFNKD